MNSIIDEIDLLEDKLFDISPSLLDILLKDHTTSTKDVQHNIFWASSDYEYLGKGYEYSSPILPNLITKNKGLVIRPRVLKNKEQQDFRAKDKAEVFTPSWMCNSQNNLIDEIWFGRKNVFNEEQTDADGKNFWIMNPDKITFPRGKTWKNYVHANRMEITCGEAPYMVSRYDTTTGEVIPIKNRIGLLDRKLRVIGENVETSGEWLEEAQEAYKSCYAYEWQGDSLLIAREAMLLSFIEYYREKFGKDPLEKSINYIAYIISWNFWQMDGLKGVVPNTCRKRIQVENLLFGGTQKIEIPCEGCQTQDIRRHNGIYCLIKDWRAKDPITGKQGKIMKYIELIK